MTLYMDLTDDIYRGTSLGFTTYPISVAVWIKSTNTWTNYNRSNIFRWGQVSLSESSGTNGISITLNSGVLPNMDIGCGDNYNDGRTSVSFNSSLNTWLANNWLFVYCAIWYTGGRRYKRTKIRMRNRWQNAQSDNTMSAPTFVSDRTVVGGDINGGQSCQNQHWQHLAVWNDTLPEHDILALGHGADPRTVHTHKLRAYWPFSLETKKREVWRYGQGAYDLTSSLHDPGADIWIPTYQDMITSPSNRLITNSPINLINTRDRRASIINHSLPFGRILPTPGI